jgi:hypothetical protein
MQAAAHKIPIRVSPTRIRLPWTARWRHALTPPATGSNQLPRPPNYKQEKKRREEEQKKRNEAKQREIAERRKPPADPQPP